MLGIRKLLLDDVFADSGERARALPGQIEGLNPAK